MVSNTYCVVFLFCFSSYCVPYVASFSGLSFFQCPIRYSLTFFCILTILSSYVTFCLFLAHPLRGVFIRIITLSLLYSHHLISVRLRTRDNNKPTSGNWHITHRYRQLTEYIHPLQTIANLSQVTDRVHTLPANNHQLVSCNWQITAIPPQVADRLHIPCR